MAAVGVQAWRSCLKNGAPYPIPDFRRKTACGPYVEDHWSPYPEDAGPGQPPPSTRGYVKPGPDAVRNARERWRGLGYDG